MGRIRLSDLRPRGRLVGISGAPGAGKSTFAAALAATYAGVVVPMDGFHLADVELARRGLLDRKGAPETFDAEGYAALLARIRARPAQVVLAPQFDRSIEQPVAGAVAVRPEDDPVVTEGNYLLLDEPRWREVRDQLDEVWHVRVDESVRLERLVARHVQFGKTADEARAWVARVDQPNAVLVEAAAERADRVLDLTDYPGGSGS
jgi:pantothenate kinase